MNKNLVAELKEKLEKEKAAIEEQLKTFADKDPNLKGDWDSKFPKFNGEFGGAALESAADEVEEYEGRLSVEHTLELRLKNIDLALEKIANNKYGKCENCDKDIDEDRLKVSPEARFCMKCSK
ncbi:MAG: TraR/DksA C4-type zinc finger protein [Candidatus Nealsonbacteria bacterium]|nr:TraR/DksA C4-type zinc finger protein [Candidatus Nealsonbacteria bacterium]